MSPEQRPTGVHTPSGDSAQEVTAAVSERRNGGQEDAYGVTSDDSGLSSRPQLSTNLLSCGLEFVALYVGGGVGEVEIVHPVDGDYVDV